ncbi:MAG: SDR family oxidoreductase, partial [Nitrosopumilus sp.]|nr:SDR family oxidoreductase [Nitrosopumilus sp.]
MKKVALVTGSSSGIGLETALALARDGYHTFASMRDIKKSAELEHAAKKENLTMDVIELDVDKEESIVSAIKKITSDYQRIDVLVNNAGYGQFGCTEDVSINDFRKQFETNFFSIVRIIQEVSPVMRKQNSGIIVNISSVGGRMGLPGSAAYISSKFALEGLSECLRYELGQFGIKVTLIEPGVIRTNFFDSMIVPESKTDPKYKTLTDNILAGLKMMVEMGT